jgi:competence protein ComEC
MQRAVQILWVTGTGFIAGVFVRTLWTVGPVEAAWVLLVAGGVAWVAAGQEQTRPVALAIFVCAIAFVAGMWRAESARMVGDAFIDAHIGSEVTLEGVVMAEPDVREGSVRIAVRAESGVSAAGPIRAGVLAIASPYIEVHYGERVRISGVILLPEAFDTAGGRQFDYPHYLATQRIGYQMQQAQVKVLAPAPTSLTGFAIGIKQAYVHGLERALAEPQAGLAAGITAGDKRGLGKDLATDFRTVSLTHIIVLSGYNITVVADALMRALSWAPQYARFGAGGFVAIFFVLMTGGAAASVRAAVMALIAMSARMSGRLYAADRALVVAAAGMAAWNPLIVVYDPGYQLSVAATAGLIWLSPRVELWCARVPAAGGLRAVCVSTIAAQIAVLPILLYQNGLLSFVALPANLLVLAFVPLAMLFSLVAGIGGMVAGVLAPIIGFPAYLVLSYLIAIARVLAHVPAAALQLPAFSPLFVVLEYGLIWFLMLRARPTKATAPEKGAVAGFFG